MIQQVITFDGGLSTKRAPHLIKRNEAVICENVCLERGSLCPLPKLSFIENVSGRHIRVQDDNIIANATLADDRFYDTYSGRLYWSNLSYGSFGLARYNDTDAGEDADAPDAPNVDPTAVTTSAGQLNGTYTYCYTFIDDTGVESAPSGFLEVTVSDKQVDLTLSDTNAPTDLDTRNIYRTGGDNPTFNLVGEVKAGTTVFSDNTRDLDVSRIELYTFENTPPPNGLDMFLECRGTFWGSVGKKVHFSRTGSPEYWGLLDYVVLDKECTGLGKFGDYVIAFTRTSAYIISGSTRDDISLKRLPFNQGCIEKHSVVNIDAYLLWTSLNGICMFNGSTVEVITKKILSWDEFGRVGNTTYADYDGTTAKWDSSAGFDMQYAVGYQDKYYGVFNNGIVMLDLSDGLKVSTISVDNVASVAINQDDNLLYVLTKNDVDGYDVYYLERGNEFMNAKWRSSRLVDETTDTVKHYRDVELDGMPISVEVFVEGKSIRLYEGQKQFKLPAGVHGRDIQFEVITNTEIRSLKYEYSVKKP